MLLERYIQHYDITSEELIGSELVLEEEWEDGDTFKGIVDRLIEKDGMVNT